MPIRRRQIAILIVLCGVMIPQVLLLGADQQPRVAVLPLAGDANAGTRDQATNLIRLLLARQGIYQPVRFDTIRDLATTMPSQPDFDTPPEALSKFAADADAEILIWGDMVQKDKTSVLRLHVFDLLQPDPVPRTIEQTLGKGMDLRTVCKQVVATLPDDRVIDAVAEAPANPAANAIADQLWQTQPDLVSNGTFDRPTGPATEWNALPPGDVTPVRVGDLGVDPDRMAIIRARATEDQPATSVLMMNLGGGSANPSGLACVSSPIAVEAKTRYRLAFSYRSQGPAVQVSIRGFKRLSDTPGLRYEQEVYRHALPKAASTGHDWVTITEDFTLPEGVRVDYVRVELGAIDTAGTTLFDDVQLKAISASSK